MNLTSFSLGPLGTNAYIYSDPISKNAVIIDAPPDSLDTLKKALAGYHPLYLLLTHSHWDHIADAWRIKEAFPEIIVAIHKEDEQNLIHPGSDDVPSWIEWKSLQPDLLIKENDILAGLKVIETPGHTPGGVVFYDEVNQVLFSGDTLFKKSIGRLDLTTGRPDLMWPSLKKLSHLPKSVRVYPGHGGLTTIGEENWLARAEEIFG